MYIPLHIRTARAAKKAIRQTIRSLGYDIIRYADPFRTAIYHKMYDNETLKRKPFYNIGAGSFYHPYWTNIDYASDRYASDQTDFINHDLTSDASLPIQSGSALIIYTSHTIEHIPEKDVYKLFREAYRCLKSGGIIRVTTGPDAETDYRALSNKDEDWFYWYQKDDSRELFYEPPSSMHIEEKWLQHVFSQLSPNNRTPSGIKLSPDEIKDKIDEMGFPSVMDYFASLCRFDKNHPNNHVSWWTNDRVIRALRSAGFSNVYRSGYQQSVSPLMRAPLFDSVHPQISLYVEAIR